MKWMNLENYEHSNSEAYKNVNELSCTIVNGAKVNLGEMYIFKIDINNYPIFIRIEKIYPKRQNKIKILGKLYKTLTRDSLNFSYEVKSGNIVEVETLYNCKRVWFLPNSNEIIKDFYFENEF